MFDGTLDLGPGDAPGDPGLEPTDPILTPGLDPLSDPVPAGLSPVGGQDEAQLWQPQEVDGLCAPTSVAIVASEFTGRFVDKDDVAAVAESHGLISQGEAGWSGMNAGETEQLLELYGIAGHVEQGDLQTLDRYLEENRGVILAVDSGEVWGTESGIIGDANLEPDHALVVTEIDQARGTATLNDPGDPAGAGREIPLTVLADAWADSSNLMVVTDAAPGEGGPPATEGSEGAPAAPGGSGEGIAGWVILPIALSASGAAALWLAGRAKRGRESEVTDPPDDGRPRSDDGGPGPERLSFGTGFGS